MEPFGISDLADDHALEQAERCAECRARSPLRTDIPRLHTLVLRLSHPFASLIFVTIRRSLRWRFSWLVFNVRQGFIETYPVCCIARFTVENLIDPVRPQGLLRPGKWRGRGYVPCGWLHPAGPPRQPGGVERG